MVHNYIPDIRGNTSCNCSYCKTSTMAVVNSIFRPGLFKGKVAIVTGGGTGIGKAITQELLHLGAKVVIASRNEDRLRMAAKEMSDHADSPDAVVKAVPCNIREESQVNMMLSNLLNSIT